MLDLLALADVLIEHDEIALTFVVLEHLPRRAIP